MATLKNYYRKYTKMYFNAVYDICRFRSMADVESTNKYDTWLTFLSGQLRLIHVLRMNVWMKLRKHSDGNDYCKAISDKFRDDLLCKLNSHCIDIRYYYEL